MPYAIQLPDLSKEVTEENEEKYYLSNRIIKKKKKKNLTGKRIRRGTITSLAEDDPIHLSVLVSGSDKPPAQDIARFAAKPK